MKRLLALCFLTSALLFAGAQDDSTKALHITSIPEFGVWLGKGWKFQASDNFDYAKPAYNDLHWKDIDPTKDVRALPELLKTDIGWFRLHVTVDSLVFIFFSTDLAHIVVVKVVLKTRTIKKRKADNTVSQ